MSLATATTTQVSPTKKGTKAVVNPLQLDEIPDAMDKMKWHTAAKLMRHWFSIKPAWRMPKAIKSPGKGFDPLISLQHSQYNDDIVKIDWLLGFSQWAEAAKELTQTWATPNGVKQLKEQLKKCGWKRGLGKKIILGSMSMSPRKVDSVCQLNYKSVGAIWDTIDGLYGAIGKGTLKIAVIGYTTVNLMGLEVFVVEKYGIYLRDTYDFIDDQFLGVWSRDRCLSKAEALTHAFRKGFVPVYNEDFRRWQDAHNSGGDFVVYSDVRWVNPDTKLNAHIIRL